MRFLIIFIFLLSNSLANEVTDLKNIVINKDIKKYHYHAKPRSIW